MAKKLNHSGYGKTNKGSIHVKNLMSKNYEDSRTNKIVNWERKIKELMRDFNFSDNKIEEILEKAKTSFKETDSELQKYKKAWNLFRKEMMIAI